MTRVIAVSAILVAASTAALAEGHQKNCKAAYNVCAEKARSYNTDPKDYCYSVAQCKQEKIFKYKTNGNWYDVQIDKP